MIEHGHILPKYYSMPRPRLSSPKHRSGFALLITVTLLAFLVLLLIVSLASLTRVETSVAANALQLSGGRQNALMALNFLKPL